MAACVPVRRRSKRPAVAGRARSLVFSSARTPASDVGFDIRACHDLPAYTTRQPGPGDDHVGLLALDLLSCRNLRAKKADLSRRSWTKADGLRTAYCPLRTTSDPLPNSLPPNTMTASFRIYPLWWFAHPKIQPNPTNSRLFKVIQDSKMWGVGGLVPL